eukprot:TRINITY_DN11342_c0_g1_i1.p1 TRINITY_DN11342_c0_g1~~TRINITY_DN11342_c0_g1_i1.p1  ORF type:complete len:583 (-),score=114.93 TRINITY_DN11342_c0_g1_i1:107-1855(-)
MLESTNASWPFTTTGTNPVFHSSGTLQGYDNLHASYSMPIVPGSLSSQNPGLGNLPAGGVPQSPGSLTGGRFVSNNLPISFSQISHGLHTNSGLPNRGGSGISSLTSNSGRSPSLGGGQTMPVSVSHVNGGVNVHSSGRLMTSILQQASTPGASQLGTALTDSVGSRNSAQSVMGNGHRVTVGSANDMNSSDTVSFNVNDFPQLGSRSTSAVSAQGQLASLRKQALSINSFAQQNHEFTMQSEDFPALSNYKGSSMDLVYELQEKDSHGNKLSLLHTQNYPLRRSGGFTVGGYDSHQQQQQQDVHSGLSTNYLGPYTTIGTPTDMLHLHGTDLFPLSHSLPAFPSQVVTGLRPGIPTNVMCSINTYDHLQQYQHNLSHSPVRFVPSVYQSSRDQSLKALHEQEVSSDTFGLLGLLGIIRRTEPGHTTLAMGIDMTTLGLDLNSRGCLYKTFLSPWADAPAKAEPEYKLPECYSQQPTKLLPGHFTKYSKETLFYIFYSMTNDESQLYASSELHRRGWFYHKELFLWLCPVPNVEPLVKTKLYERGSYFAFDPKTWEVRRKDNFELVYDKIEKKPEISQLPQS